ncbi:HNH endonuclease [Corynebacterium halotolerans]|uniref:HNH endonuclease n=1 Tax=Corynebacterium halotolerans TaxID=225326 RepID=UPI00034DD0A4|nr:HNH endonuclease [Corynebacterium halotolerans]
MPDHSYALQFHDDGTAELTARLTPADAVAVDARVRALAEAEKITLTTALVRLLMGDEGVKVILDLYRAMDVPDAPAYLPKAGWLDRATTDEWVARATQVRDIDQVADTTTGAYQTPAAMRAYVVGRDGVCRCPDCGKSADDCEMDHRVNHADGGPTTPGNLASLCRRDHNLKTSGVVFYFMNPHTGDIIWLHDDGRFTCTEPEGPLSRTSRLWLQSLHSRREERNHRARQEAQHRKRLHDQDNGIPEEDTPPPF